MKILIVSIHVRKSAQAVALAAGNLKASCPPEIRPNVRLLDLYLQQPAAEMLELINSQRANLIAFSLYLWNRERTLTLVDALKQTQRPAYILLGGPEASADSQRLLKRGSIDAVLRGEGEESFAKLVSALEKGKSPAGIEGLYTDAEQHPTPACSCDLDRLNSPWLNGTLEPVDGGVLWEVARGCPFNCSFCYDAKGLAGVRPLPEQRLSAELEVFTDQAVDQVWVLDSSFNAPKKRGKKLLRLLHKMAPDLHYHLEAKAEFIDEESISLLSKLSCSIQLGLQTANTEVLASLNRTIDPQRFWRGVKQVSEAGLTFGLDLIYGLPGDSVEGFYGSVEQALAYRPDQLDVFPLAVLPGTKLYEQKLALQLQASSEPPYLLLTSPGFSKSQMLQCSMLKTSIDLFYNRGRAVGFFLPFCQALEMKPLELLETFSSWFEGSTDALDPDALTSEQIFTIQQQYLRILFQQKNKVDLWPLASDVLRYHYYYAETLIGHETLPRQESISAKGRLVLNPGVQLVSFETNILGAVESEEVDLKRWDRQVDKTPTDSLMIRRGREIISEVLTEDFAELLKRARKPQYVQDLLAGLPGELGAELLQFSLQEGLLLEEKLI